MLNSQLYSDFKILYTFFLKLLILEPQRFPIVKFERNKKELQKNLAFLPSDVAIAVWDMLKTVAQSYTLMSMPLCVRLKFKFKDITPMSETIMLYMRRAILFGLTAPTYEEALLMLAHDLEDSKSLTARRFKECNVTPLDVITIQKIVVTLLFIAFLADVTADPSQEDIAIPKFEKRYAEGSKRISEAIGKARNATPLEMAIVITKAQAGQ